MANKARFATMSRRTVIRFLLLWKKFRVPGLVLGSPRSSVVDESSGSSESLTGAYSCFSIVIVNITICRNLAKLDLKKLDFCASEC